MQSFKRRIMQFTRCAYVMDLRTDAPTQRMKEISDKAARYEARQQYTRNAKRYALGNIRWLYVRTYAAFGTIMHDEGATHFTHHTQAHPNFRIYSFNNAR